MNKISSACPLSWQTLWISGLPTRWLDCAHGFVEAPDHTFPVAEPIIISAMRDFGAPAQTTMCLETEFGRVELCSNASARLNFTKPIPIGNPKALLPLTAALTQQWLLSGSLTLHAAVFQVNHRTLLVLGNSLAGKSTLVRSALQIGATVVSDDLVRLSFSTAQPPDMPDEQIIAHSLRGFVRFRQAGNLPEQCIWIDPSDRRFVSSMKIDAVVFLDSAPRATQTVIGTISVLEATAQLINQSAPLFLRRGFQFERAKMVVFIQRILQQLPTIRATSGFDFLNSPERAFSRLLAAIWPNA